MYSYIKGIVTKVKPAYIVLENNNIGYQILTPNNFGYKQNEEQIIFLYQHVREDAITLFGFKSEDERDFFIKLLNVTGIGPKSALSLLSGDNLDSLVNAIETSNVKFLSSFPGIGGKTASQIILDLKGKLALREVPTNISDAVEALGSLGYSKDKINSTIKKITITNDMSSSQIVKVILREINK